MGILIICYYLDQLYLIARCLSISTCVVYFAVIFGVCVSYCFEFLWVGARCERDCFCEIAVSSGSDETVV